MAKTGKNSRVPSPIEISTYSGMHCPSLYREALSKNWRCPCCHRSAPEVIRWTEIKGPAWRAKYADAYGMGFTAPLCKHHCHGKGRFEITLICGDCNSADGAVKLRLKLPQSWSFAPEEIARFVSVPVHSGRTTIDYEVAKQIYEDQVAQTGILRSKVLKTRSQLL